jgi:hypothetical protein
MSAGLANPLGAAAFAAIVALLALHLWDWRRRVIPVSTLFLWRRLPPAPPLERRRRLRPDLLFWLQLGCLSALAVGYLRPWIATRDTPPDAPALLLVIDVSASMQAREADGRRLDRARAEAAALVRDDADTMLVAAGGQPRVVVRWTRDATLVRRRLETLEALDVAGDLAPALALALGEARVRPGTRVAVFTDLPPQATGLAPDDLAVVDYVQVGRTDDNVAVSQLTVDAPPFVAAAHATATVAVRNHAGTDRQVRLEAAVGDRPWAHRDLVLAPHGTATVHLERPPAAGVLTVTLETRDALAADDVALAWIAPGTPVDLLVVSATPAPSNPLVALARAIPGGRAEVVPPERAGTAAARADRIVVFDRVVPFGVEPARALYVAPPVGNPVCPTEAIADDAAVVDWDTDHPLLAGQGGLEALVVPRASVLATPSWGTAVALAASRRQTFPFVVAGEPGARRIVCLATALSTPLAATDQLPLLLLTLGALAWLDPGNGTSPLVVRTGVPMRAGATAVVAERVGAQPTGSRLVLASLQDDQESAIGRDGGGTWPATARPASAPGAGAREIGWWLYFGGALLLGGEWVAWRRRVAGHA